METGSTVFILLTLLAATAAFLLTAIGVFICSYLRDLSALKEELRRTADEGKYCLGVRELRRKYLKRLPFITEKNLSRVYRRIFAGEKRRRRDLELACALHARYIHMCLLPLRGKLGVVQCLCRKRNGSGTLRILHGFGHRYGRRQKF